MSVLRQIGRTFLLCAGLGIGLYIGISQLAGYPRAAMALVTVPYAALLLFWAWEVWDAYRTGEFPYWIGIASRRDRPAAYWGHMIFAIAALLCGVAVLVVALHRLSNPS
jgi:hypothetical protein